MKKELKNKLFFISGVVFAFALLGGAVVVAQAVTNSWTPPTSQFPQANVYPPIDSGPDKQQGELIIRSGGLSLEGKVFQSSGSIVPGAGKVLEIPTDRWINSGNNIFTLKNNDGNIVPFSALGQFVINTNGIVLPNKNKTQEASITKKEGTIYYNTTDKKVQLWNGTAWTDLGGSGGDSVWTKTLSGVGAYFDGDAVLGTMGESGGYEPTGRVFKTNTNVLDSLDYKQPFALINKVSAAPDYENNRLTECDKSDVSEECFGFIPVTGTRSIGDIKYDRYLSYEGPELNPGPPKVTYKELEYKIKTGTITPTGVFHASDINLSNPQYSSTSGEIGITGGSKTLSMDNYVEGWATCPPGYFVSAFRFGRNTSADLTPVVKCSKL